MNSPSNRVSVLTILPFVCVLLVPSLAGAKGNKAIAALQADVAALQNAVADLEGTVGELEPDVGQLQTTVSALQLAVGSLESSVGNLEASVNQLTDLLIHFTRQDNEIFITGANLNVRNGDGDTETTNGLGNLIVGYNSDLGDPADRTGSHNLVVGGDNSYSSFGGIVAGIFNEISGAYATVLGGEDNVASGDLASIAGGWVNEAQFQDSTVAGGAGNIAGRFGAHVCGGRFNIADGQLSVVSGGDGRNASDIHDWAGGTLLEDN